MGIISGSIWGSFQGWGSFRGRDHFGGCTDRLACHQASIIQLFYMLVTEIIVEKLPCILPVVMPN